MSNIRVYAIHNNPIDEVTYIITSENAKDCIIVDPAEIDSILTELEKRQLHCVYILLTHEHYDHISAVNELLKEEDCRIIASKACAKNLKDSRTNMSAYYDALMKLHGVTGMNPTADYVIDQVHVVFDKCYELNIWGEAFRLISTPGHSPGSICIEYAEGVFTGDSLLKDSKPITKLPLGNRKEYQEKTLPYLLQVDPKKKVFPGHGEPFLIGENAYLSSYRIN